jgi:hypothetical protein
MDTNDRNPHTMLPTEVRPQTTSLAELGVCEAPATLVFEELIRTGKVTHFASGVDDVTQAFEKDYNAPGADFSIVPTIDWQTVPLFFHPYTLSEMLRQNMPMEVHIYPTSEGLQDTNQSVSDLVDHLHDMNYRGTKSMAIFHPLIMDPFAKPMPSGQFDSGTLPPLSAGSMSIMPSGTVLPLECSTLTDYSEIHVLTGTRVYFVWPPTVQNMATFQCYLDKFPASQHLEVYNHFQDGITFVQRPGQVVRLPPFCPTVVLATKISAGALFRFRRYEGLPPRLRHLDLLSSQIAAVNRHDPYRLATMLQYQLMQLHKDLQALLSASGLAPQTNSKIIARLGVEWRSCGSYFRELVEQHISNEMIVYLVDIWPRLWDFAVQAFNLSSCPICHLDNEWFPVVPDVFLRHFCDQHWGISEHTILVQPIGVATDNSLQMECANHERVIAPIIEPNSEEESLTKKSRVNASMNRVKLQKKIRSSSTEEDEEYTLPQTRSPKGKSKASNQN